MSIQKVSKYVQQYVKQVKEGDKKTLLPLMKTFFTLYGKQYHMDDHWMLKFVYNVLRPKRTLLKCARQIGKTQNVLGRCTLDCLISPFYRNLIVAPRHAQCKRISEDVLSPYIHQSPIYDKIMNKNCTDSQLKKTFTTGSSIELIHTLLSPDPARSISNIASMYVDEIQDIQWEFLPVLAQTMAANDLGFHIYTGTPKTFTNTIQILWEKSSQGEWCIPCKHCHKDNIACTNEQLLKMIGKKGPICAFCSKPLNCKEGFFLHKFPNRRTSFVGRHVPQVIHPYHTRHIEKWREFLRNMEEYEPFRFFNECFGESYDDASTLITISDIKETTNFSVPMNKETAKRRVKKYGCSIMGIDWTGAGDSKSFTKIAIGGLLPGSDIVEICYWEELPKYLGPLEENAYILKLIEEFNPQWIAHDYGGGGNLREMGLVHSGLNLERIAGYTYVTSVDKNVIVYNPPSEVKSRASYSIDKTRSLIIMSYMIKAQKISFVNWDVDSENCPLRDLTNLVQDTTSRSNSSQVTRIIKKPETSDDLADAINYVVSTAWRVNQCYPNISEAQQYRITKTQMREITGGSEEKIIHR